MLPFAGLPRIGLEIVGDFFSSSSFVPLERRLKQQKYNSRPATINTNKGIATPRPIARLLLLELELLAIGVVDSVAVGSTTDEETVEAVEEVELKDEEEDEDV